MKIIPISKVTSIQSGSENSNYPAENVLDEHPKKVWRSTSKEYDYLECDVTGGMSGVAMFNITADHVVIRIKDPNSIKWDTTYEAVSASTGIEWDTTYEAVSASTSGSDGIEWNSGIDEEARDYTTSDFGNTGSLFAIFEDFDIPVNIKIQFYGDKKNIISLGVLIIGDVLNIGSNPDYGITQSFEDYGIIKELNNGSYYYKQRDIVRTITGTLTIVDNLDTLYAMAQIPKLYGKRPLAWLLTDTGTRYDNNFVIYGRLEQMPQSEFETLNINRTKFSIKEVI